MACTCTLILVNAYILCAKLEGIPNDTVLMLSFVFAEESTCALNQNWSMVADLVEFVADKPHTLSEHKLKLLISRLGLDLNLFIPPPTSSSHPTPPIQVDAVFMTMLQSWAAVEEHLATFGRLTEELERNELYELAQFCRSFQGKRTS